MCFSATGSFGVAAVLAGLGAVSVTQKKSATHRLLAATPLLFAAQQVTEGIVWRTIHDVPQQSVQLLAVALFLGFALVVYPLWSPLSLFLAEKSPPRRKGLAVLLALGGCVSIYAGSSLVSQLPVARVTGHSLSYSYFHPGSPLVLALYLPAYVVPTVLPFFVSTMNKAKLMGTVLLVGLLATFIIKRQALTSVWCFFAAVMSGVIVLSIAAERRLELLAAEHRLASELSARAGGPATTP